MRQTPIVAPSSKSEERGYVLLVVVIFSFTLFALATTYVGKTQFDRRSSMDEIRRMQATELARAGVELGRDSLSRRQSAPEEDLRRDLPTGSVRVEFEPSKTSEGVWRLTSTGLVPSATQSVMEVTVSALVGSPPENATGTPARTIGYLEGEKVSGEEVK